MRLDKFLKLSRIIKRRTLAKEICNQNRILINGKPGKASSNVQPGDQLSIQFSSKTLVIQIEQVADHVTKDEANSLYRVLEEIPVTQNQYEEDEEDYLFR